MNRIAFSSHNADGTDNFEIIDKLLRAGFFEDEPDPDEYRETPEEVEARIADLVADRAADPEWKWRRRVPHLNTILHSRIAPRKPLITHNGTPAFLEGSINMLWAYRGIGKSIVALCLTKLFAQGGQWLDFKSEGGSDVLLIDGELPGVQVQERAREFIGHDTEGVRIWSPEFDTQGMPNFNGPLKDQLWEAVETIEPKVVIFDTLTRCFRIDTNDSEQWLEVNDTLIRLRQRGICVIVVHHAGKNETQRGRTDADDNLDLSIKLAAPFAWQPGDGLAFKWTYEKVRHGGSLKDFEAEYKNGVWGNMEDPRRPEVLRMAGLGKSSRAIAFATGLSQSTITRMLKAQKKRAGGIKVVLSTDSGPEEAESLSH